VQVQVPSFSLLWANPEHNSTAGDGGINIQQWEYFMISAPIRRLLF